MPAMRTEADSDGVSLAPRNGAGFSSSSRGDDGSGDAVAEDMEQPAGSTVDIYSLQNCGYLAQYFVVGLIYGGLPATMYGVLSGYLNTPAYVYSASSATATLPWSFKFAFGALNDCFPIRGYRRKPYMVFGWGLCTVALVALWALRLPEQPYWCRSDQDGSFVTTCDPSTAAQPGCEAWSGGAPSAATPCNADAAKRGGGIALLMCVACLGYVVADVAADGLTVTYAQREPPSRRGYTQSTAYLVRGWGFLSSALVVGFGMNGREYNGSFEWSLSFGGVCLIFALFAAAMVPLSWWYVVEERVSSPPPVGEYARSVWALLSHSAFFSIVLFSLLYAGIGMIRTPSDVMVKRYWAGVQNLQNQIFRLVGYLIYLGGLSLTRRHLLNASWRKMLAVTVVSLTLTDAFFGLFTIYDVVRNQYFYFGEEVLVEIPAAVQFLVTTFVVVEAAGPDNGGLVYGLLTTAHNIGLAFSPPISNQIFGHFRPSLSNSANYINDAPAFRDAVAASFLLSYAFSFVSFAVLPLLPDQKESCAVRKRTWPASPAFAYASLALLIPAFVYSLTITLLTMVPEYQCLELVGGDGCDDGAGGGGS